MSQSFQTLSEKSGEEARRGVKLSSSSRNMELQIVPGAELQISPINSQNISITQTVVCKIQP